MSEDQRTEASRRGADGGLEGDTEPSMLQQRLKNNISKTVQTKVDQILQAVQRFSDNDKLYLYLQLPSGPSSADKSIGDSSSFSTADQLLTCNWIRSHLEEHADTCLPKQDVYETYKRYCENLHHRPLSAANFGKIIRDIFPNIKARRLGGRGQSKYCHSGIRRKTVLNMPLLPNLDLKNDPAELTELVQTYKQEVTEAACELICDWAQKILKRSFDTVVEIARYLIQEHIVNPRCSQAELVTSATLAGGPPKPHKVIKKAPMVCKAESDGAADQKKDAGDSSSIKSPSGDKPCGGGVKPSSMEAPPPPSSSSLHPAVEAFMKQLPRILPRSSLPDKSPLSVRSSPPSLAPKDAPGAAVGGASGPGAPPAGGMKVIAMATLHKQAGGPVPVMILRQGCLPYDREPPPPPPPVVPQPPPLPPPSAAPTSVVQKARGPPQPKRPLEAVTSAGAGSAPNSAPTVKRKRGRPRKLRAEEVPAPPPPPPPPPAQAPPPAPPPPPHVPIITSVSGGVIQKASSSSSSVLELVIQERPGGLVLNQQGGAGESERHSLAQPLLLLQGGAPLPPPPHWDPAPSGRTAMVEVIQKAPRPNNNNNNNNSGAAVAPPLPAAVAPPPLLPHLPPPPPPPHLPPPLVHEELGEVELMLTPVELPPVNLAPPPLGSAPSSATPPSPTGGRGQ